MRSNRHHLHLHLLQHLRRQFTAGSPLPAKLKHICYRHRARALREARSALTEYLHCTRSLPFSFSEHIAANSPSSLSLLLSQIPSLSSSPPSLFPRLLRSHLSYRPVNEFDFLLESIGPGPGPTTSPTAAGPFLSDHPLLLSFLSSLLSFGFPWTRLGLLYPSLPLSLSPPDPLPRLLSLESLGFPRVSVIALSLSFPSLLLLLNHQTTPLLLRDLHSLFLTRSLAASVPDNLDAHLAVCRRIKLFYDRGGCLPGATAPLLGPNKNLLLHVDESVIANKLDYFSRLGMPRAELGSFLLRNADVVFDLDLDSPTFAMPDYLLRAGMCEDEAEVLARKYPYAMGGNAMANLPETLRAMGVREWVLGRVVVDGGLRFLSPEFVSCSSAGKSEAGDEYVAGVERMREARKQKHHYIDNKLEFLLGIGFGKNKITSRAAGLINSTKDQLRMRFDCLLGMGIEYSMLCRMIHASPKLLNNCPESLREKVDYLRDELGYPLEYLDKFPSFLCFDLENRTKPRYRILHWLKENGLLQKPFAPATVLANSEKRFITQLFSIHPAAPKQWLEIFSSRFDSNGFQRSLFSPRPLGPSESES